MKTSRRDLLAAGIAAAAASGMDAQTPAALTAEQVVERIKANIGVPWASQTVDNIVLGDPKAPVKGIATTMMATLAVVQRCVAAGRNLIISHETPVYMHQDDVKPIEQDSTYVFKKDYCAKENAVVFHFHDHWHRRRPDGIGFGMVRELGWEKNTDPENSRAFHFPGTPLAQFTRDMSERLKIRTLRVLGDPKMAVNRVVASWGYMSSVPMASRADCDVLVVGETREWEVVPYIQDCIASGKKKALIVMGHVVSEQSGMKYCAEWLKGFVTEVPIEFIAAPEPFWLPEKPVA